MDSELHWWVWLLSGVAVGALPLLGDNRMVGILQTIVVVASPFAIFMKAGANYLPFALFFGGLIVATSIGYRLRRKREDAALDDSIQKKKRRLRG